MTECPYIANCIVVSYLLVCVQQQQQHSFICWCVCMWKRWKRVRNGRQGYLRKRFNSSSLSKRDLETKSGILYKGVLESLTQNFLNKNTNLLLKHFLQTSVRQNMLFCFLFGILERRWINRWISLTKFQIRLLRKSYWLTI